MDLKILGSQIAKNGFKTEDDIIDKFNNWKKDIDAQNWLLIMQYKLKEIDYCKAIKITNSKTDIQAQITIKQKTAIDSQNLQIKLVSNLQGYNQIDKRRVDKYTEMWEIPNHIVCILKKYTGEELPNKNTRDERRTFADEFLKKEQKQILAWLNKHKFLMVSDILKGRGQFAAEWMLVAKKLDFNTEWVLKSMNYCINFFGNGEIKITNRGNFQIGKITMQRKGGDAGRKTAKMLQFKINPAKLFKE